jgi:hypothetical protein
MSETAEMRPGPGTSNPLVKTDAASDESSLEGAGILQDFWDTGAKISSGDWAEGLANLANGTIGLVGLAVDPIGTLLSAGFGWIIEHVPFLRDLLDMLVGDQVALDNMIGTWENVGKELEQVGEDLHKTVDHDSAGWKGPAADAYRAFAKDRADLYAGLASGANAMGMLVSLCKTILAVVRTIVRDLVSEALAKLVSILMRYPGPAAPAGLAAEGVPKAIQYAQKAMGWIKKLAKAFGEANKLFKMLMDLFVKVKDLLAPVTRGVVRVARGAVGGVKTVATTLENAGSFTENLLKESLKGVGKGVDKVRKDDEPKQAGLVGPNSAAVPSSSSPKRTEQPIFDHQGGQRISGSLE